MRHRCLQAMVAVLLLVLCVGCTTKDRASFYYSEELASKWVDDFGASHLAQTAPHLMEVCKMAGSCDAVYVESIVFVNGLNGFAVSVPGAGMVIGVSAEGIDDAAVQYINTVRSNKAYEAYRELHK